MNNLRKIVIVIVAVISAMAATALEFKEERSISYHSAETLAKEGAYAADRCKVDLRYPVGVTNFATVVNIHGGGLVAGGKHYAPWPVEAKGKDPVAFVAVGYRLITNATPQQCVGDAAAAVAWTLKNISRHGGDPKKVFVTGISGGGYLTAMIGMDPKWLEPHGLKPLDLAGIIPLTGQVTKHFNVRAVSFKDADPRYAPKVDEWAPLYHVKNPDIPPCCFLTGGRLDDELPCRVEENEFTAISLIRTGHKKVEFHETEGSHGGGVEPSSYYLRDCVMKWCDAGGVGRIGENERIAFFGDSITHGGAYTAFLQLYADLRHPGLNSRLMNVGISGDSAGGGLDRMGWDLLAKKPNRVFVMFGMNDVGRDLYKDAEPDAKTAAARASRLAAYEKNQRALVAKLLAAGVKVCLVTPSPFNQYASDSACKAKNTPYCNDPGLATCAKIVRSLAAERNLGVVELHEPLTKIFKEHPDTAFCPDRVHPGADGHMIMAALFLEAMGVSPTVAQVSIDGGKLKMIPRANKAKLPETKNARVSAIVRSPDGGLSFTYAPKALPLPKTADYVKAEKFYPLTERLNQERFIVSGLSAGRYALAFDGEKVGEFSAEEFAAGVNVALLDTPNQRRAQAAALIADQLRAHASGKQRNEANMQWKLRRAKIDPKDTVAADKWFDEWVAGLEARKSTSVPYYRNVVAAYRKNRAEAPSFQVVEDDLRARLSAVRPAISRVTIRKCN